MIIRMCGGAEMLHRVWVSCTVISKPSNIMVNAYGSPVLTDFGVAEHVGDRSAQAAMVFRSCGRREQSPVRASIRRRAMWALGARRWTLLMGRPPFRGARR